MSMLYCYVDGYSDRFVLLKVWSRWNPFVLDLSIIVKSAVANLSSLFSDAREGESGNVQPAATKDESGYIQLVGTQDESGYIQPAATKDESGYIQLVGTQDESGYIQPAATEDESGYVQPAAVPRRQDQPNVYDVITPNA